jgi:drug/metabolite transporter (DMT)-like permease
VALPSQAAPQTRGAAGRATLWVALSAAGFAAISIFVLFATGAGAPLLSVLSWRYIIGAAVLAVIAWATGAIRQISRPGLNVMAFAGLGQSIIAVETLLALQFIPAATLSFLFYTYPGWVAIIARVRHSEPLTPVRLIALALSLGGIVVMVGAPGTGSLNPIGVTLGLVGGLLYAIYVPMLNELQRNLSSVATATYMATGAAIILSITAAIRGELIFQMHSTAWLAILGLSLISTVGAFLVFLRGLREIGPLRTAIISTVEPFFTALMGAWLLSQPLTATTLIGGALIAGAVILLQLPTANNFSGRS